MDLFSPREEEDGVKMVLAHSFYCNNGECDNEVEHYNDICPDCTDTLSDNSHHCIGCGEDMFVSSNGYCGTCWTEKLEEELTHEPLSWYHGGSRYCTDCDQWYVFMKDAEYQHCPDCRMYGHSKCNECGCPEQNDVLLQEMKDGQLLCGNCVYELELQERDKINERIVFINEKLQTNMTASQTADWNLLLDRAFRRLRELPPEEPDEDIYDQDDQNKMDREMRMR